MAEEATEQGFVYRRARVVQALALSPAIILLASAARLLLIANYDSTTATTIASSSGITGTLLGTIIPLLPPYLPAITLALIAFRRWTLAIFCGIFAALLSPSYVIDPREAWDIAYFGMSNFFRLLTEGLLDELWATYPFAAFSGAVGVVSVGLLVPNFSAPSFAPTVEGAFLRPIAGFVYALVVGLFSVYATLFVQAAYNVPFNTTIVSEIGRRPWLPAEQLVLKSGGIRVGYTLSAGEKWNVVLNESNRQIVFIPADDVTSRTVCRPRLSYANLPRLPLVPAENVRTLSPSLCPVVQ